MNYIDSMLKFTIDSTNKIISFISEFKLIFAIGFLAMMVAKALKLNIKI